MKFIRHTLSKLFGRTGGRADGWTGGWTDGRTDGHNVQQQTCCIDSIDRD